MSKKSTFRSDFDRSYHQLAFLRLNKDVDGLISALDNPIEEKGKRKPLSVREAAARSLGRIGDERAVEPLGRLVKDTNLSVRVAATRALGRIGSPRAMPWLVQALTDAHWVVQSYAISGLATLRDPSAVEHLLPFLSSSRWQLRRDAAKALARIGDRSATPALRAARNREARWNLWMCWRITKAIRELERP